MEAFLIAWTARLSVGCWGVRVLQTARRSDRIPRRADVFWSTAGWLLLVTHVLCAFHFQHHWSHAEAYAHTARRTAETVGWNWGGGLYVNYVALALWAADLLVSIWACRRQLPLARWWRWSVDGMLGFLMFNATLVFGPRGWWAAALAFGVALWLSRRRLTA